MNILENPTILTLKARPQRRAVRRGINCFLTLAGVVLCTQVACSGNTSTGEDIEPASLTAATLLQTGWKLKFVDSEELVGSDGRGVNGFDGATGTIWHTKWLNGSPPPPHEIQINLGSSANLNGFVYVPRQDGSQNGRIGQYEFYVSTDGVNWGSPVATGTFANDATNKQVSFTPTTGQYVRLRALSEVNGKPYTSMAELRLIGTTTGGGTNQAPDSVNTNPPPPSTTTSPPLPPPTIALGIAWDGISLAGGGYYVHYGTQSPKLAGSCAYSQSIYYSLSSLANPSAPTATISGLTTSETYYFAVSAYDGTVEGPCSNEISRIF
jgi:hypothetical protein